MERQVIISHGNDTMFSSKTVLIFQCNNTLLLFPEWEQFSYNNTAILHDYAIKGQTLSSYADLCRLWNMNTTIIIPLCSNTLYVY